MNQKHLAAFLGALLAAPLGALAQQSARTPDPADPRAAVLPIVYESAFSRPAAPPRDEQPTPDKAWRAANETVAAPPSGHGGHAAHGAAHAPATPATAAEPVPALQPAPVDHSKHH